jgi:hypothetical protein
LRKRNKRLNCRIREKFQELRGPVSRITFQVGIQAELYCCYGLKEKWVWAATIGELSRKEVNMNAEILKGQWKEIKGDIKAKWGKLTDDDLTEIEGKEEKLIPHTFATSPH